MVTALVIMVTDVCGSVWVWVAALVMVTVLW